ncbi:MAG TPA: PaaI family thioesterase [Clostridiales bacterium]|nr:MAG: thioesterase [Clostridiales bacterium GWD2_32_59]HAN09138.1 PaaI family thioesterase [Clostridiales bacterium]
MKYRVLGKQNNSRMCFVCGLNNGAGLWASFYEINTGELVAVFTPREEHQSYPERLHGGISATILDETMGRVINITEADTWGVTMELKIRYKKPVPLNQELRVVGRLVKNSSRLFECTGEILLPDGEIAVVGEGKYLKQPIEKIADFDHEKEMWSVDKKDSDPKEIEL